MKNLSFNIAKGLTEISWNEGTKKYEVDVITTITPESNPEKLMAAIVFDGYFATREDGKIIEGDKLYLNHVKRIGIDYAKDTSLVTAGKPEGGPYTYLVNKVELDQKGKVKLLELILDVGVTKGLIRIERVSYV